MLDIPLANVIGFTSKLRVARYTPNVARDLVLIRQNLLSLQDTIQNGPAPKQLNAALRVFHVAGSESVHAFDDPLFGTFRHLGHRVVFISDHDVVDGRFALSIHLLQSIEDQHSGFVIERWVISSHRRESHRVQETVPILMLKSLPIERRPSSGSAEHEALGTHVRRSPDEVADALEPEHRVVDEEWNHVHAMGRVSGPCGIEGRHRTGFGDPFFEDLAVFRFRVVCQLIGIDWLVELPRVSVDADLAEHTFHAEGSGLVWHNRHYVFADLLVLAESAQDTDNAHGRGKVFAVIPFHNLAIIFETGHFHFRNGRRPTRQRTTQLFALREQVFHFRAVLRRFVEGHFPDIFIGNRNPETTAELE